MIAQRIQPPIKAQTLGDSCWAACMDAWSKADGRFGGFLSEMDLVGDYGETITGGITPANVFPKFEGRWRMWSDGFNGDALWKVLVDGLKTSHIMAGYKRGPGQWHAVLIYKITDDFMIHAMDPDRGRLGAQKIDFFQARSPIGVLGFK